MAPHPSTRGSSLRLLALTLLLTGCGSMHFSYHSVRATRHVEQARQMGAEELAPYEFELASLYLDKAHEEAGKAEYQDAVALARVANEQALAAVQQTRKAKARQREDAAQGAEANQGSGGAP